MYSLSPIFSPNLSRTLSAETKTGGSINSKSSPVKLSITFIETSLKVSKGLVSIAGKVFENSPKNS